MDAKPVLRKGLYIRKEDKDKYSCFIPWSRRISFFKKGGFKLLSLCNGERSIADVCEEQNIEVKNNKNQEIVLKFFQKLLERDIITIKKK